MVFHYTIRGGKCLNEHSHVTLSSSDITCYVGRDKHENEYLIKYGWPGDIWFHVEGLSSAHVYFRLQKDNQWDLDSIPMDDLPDDSVEDMMQIVKHNSISGCKLASCKIVYTPHSNLKKTFEMDSGTVTYHDTRLCRYKRCNKDRARVKELEKTKIERHNVNYFDEMKQNERRIIERRKQKRSKASQSSTELYDPMRDDLKSMKLKSSSQGDASSGIDQGMAALEELRLGSGIGIGRDNLHSIDQDKEENENEDDLSKEPIWIQEDAQRRQYEVSDDIRFFIARGYTLEQAKEAYDPSIGKIKSLARLWNKVGEDALDDDKFPENDDAEDLSPEEINERRQEEREVLQAIFCDDESAVYEENEEESEISISKLDAVFPIGSYEPPERYGLPPPLVLEVYVDNGVSLYPKYKDLPVLAVCGGGLPEAYLQKLTISLYKEAKQRSMEEPSDPQIFNLVTFVGEQVEVVVEEERKAYEKEQERIRREQIAKYEAERKAQAAAKAEEEEANAVPTNFKSEAERRAYAQEVLAKGGDSFQSTTASSSGDTSKKTKKHYNTGVSDQSLIEDLFS